MHKMNIHTHFYIDIKIDNEFYAMNILHACSRTTSQILNCPLCGVSELQQVAVVTPYG